MIWQIYIKREDIIKAILVRIEMKNKYIVKSKRENNDNKNMNTKDKSVRL